MRGVGGYMFDMAEEIGRLKGIFRGGVECMPGVPVMLGGCEDYSLIRSIIEAGRWLEYSGSQFPRKTWEIMLSDLFASGRGDVFN